MFILPFAIIFVAIVITVIIIFVSNNSDVVEQEEVVIKPEEVIPSNPDLLTIEGRTSAFGTYSAPTHDSEVPVESTEPDSSYDEYDFGDGVYTFNFVINSMDRTLESKDIEKFSNNLIKHFEENGINLKK